MNTDEFSEFPPFMPPSTGARSSLGPPRRLRYELSAGGEIVRVAPDGMSKLVQMQPPSKAGETDRAKVTNAVRTFHLARSNCEQRKQAVRDLVDVLEFHRSAVKSHLSKDEGDLFNIANNFALRHHRADQKDDYDDGWLTWLFYIYLATVHLVLGRASHRASVGLGYAGRPTAWGRGGQPTLAARPETATPTRSSRGILGAIRDGARVDDRS